MNALCKILNIKFPIFLGGMGNISSPELAAAVSNAGGLGTIGVGTRAPDEIEQQIAIIKEKTNQPFAINIPIAVSPYSKEMADLAVKHKVPAVSLSAGNPTPFIKYFHEHGIRAITVVGSVKQALKAAEAGADVIVGEGYEAAGINSPLELTTLTLIPQLADAVNIPIVAAGGIADGRGLAAAFALGAQGVQMGTRFIAAKEAPYSKEYKEKVINANDQSTVIIGRTVGKIRRVLKGSYVNQLLDMEKEGIDGQKYLELTSEEAHWLGAIEGNEEKGFMNSGQAAAIVKQEQTVQDIIDSIMKEAKTRIESNSLYFG